MAFDPHRPHNDLPPLPQAVSLETTATMRSAIAAGRALAELKAVGEWIPNPSILVHAIRLQEARSSSEIEGIVTTTDELYKALSNVGGAAEGSEAKEVLRYSDALWEGYQQLVSGRPLGAEMYEEIGRRITPEAGGIRETELVRIASKAGGVVYTPPAGPGVVRRMLANLDEYIRAENQVDPLLKLAAIHYQFEAIHPFSDGNGRTGRILNILYLVERGLLVQPVLYLSRFLIRHRADYYRLLRGVTERGQWESWVLFMLEAVERTSLETVAQVIAIRDLMEDFRERIRKARPNLPAADLVEVLFDRPYCKTGLLVEKGIAKRQTASKYLQELAKAGLIAGGRKAGREVVYLNHEFLELLRKVPGEEA